MRRRSSVTRPAAPVSRGIGGHGRLLEHRRAHRQPGVEGCPRLRRRSARHWLTQGRAPAHRRARPGPRAVSARSSCSTATFSPTSTNPPPVRAQFGRRARRSTSSTPARAAPPRAPRPLRASRRSRPAPSASRSAALADERHRGEMGAERMRDQAGFDRADPLLAADRQRAELDELLPHPPPALDVALRPRRQPASHSRSSSVSIDSLSHRCSSVSSRSMATPWGARARGRR